MPMLKLKPGVDVSQIPRELWYGLGAAALMRFRMGKHGTLILETSNPTARLKVNRGDTFSLRLRVSDMAPFDVKVLVGALQESIGHQGFTVYTNDAGLYIEYDGASNLLFISVAEDDQAPERGT
jgi:hypothetical protein